MKFILRKASDHTFSEEIEVDDLEELERLSRKYGEDLVISFVSKYNKNNIIRIYDDYME